LVCHESVILIVIPKAGIGAITQNCHFSAGQGEGAVLHCRSTKLRGISGVQKFPF